MHGRLLKLSILTLLLALTLATTAHAQAPGEIHLTPIENGDEVMLRLPGGKYIAPEMETINGSEPRIILDFVGIKKWEKALVTGHRGRVIKNVRAYLHAEEKRLRVVFDLAVAPNKALASLGYDEDSKGTFFTLRAILHPRYR